MQGLTPEQHTKIQNIIHYSEKRKQERGWLKKKEWIDCFDLI